jgi:hypothetical protein
VTFSGRLRDKCGTRVNHVVVRRHSSSRSDQVEAGQWMVDLLHLAACCEVTQVQPYEVPRGLASRTCLSTSRFEATAAFTRRTASGPRSVDAIDEGVSSTASASFVSSPMASKA